MINDTREHILKVAAKLFLQKHFKEVTMKEIVEATGMSKGAFYHYFPSKDKLFFEIVENFLSWAKIDYEVYNQESLYEFFNAVLDSSKRFIPKLQEWFSIDAQSVRINFYILIFDALNRYPGFLEEIKQHHQAEMAAWKKVIGTARKKGEIKSPMSDEQIAKFFAILPDGASLQGLLFGRFEELESDIRDLYESFYQELTS